MFLTIIISLKNDQDGLKTSLESIAAQTYNEDISVIIVDGVSSDGPEIVVESFRNRLDIEYDSQPDTGIYDAWNRALPKIRGDWTYFMGAGDIFHSSTVVQCVKAKISRLAVETVIAYGRVTFLSERGNPLEVVNRAGFSRDDVASGMPLCHQGIFQRSSSFATLGPFDTNFKIAADFEMFLRTIDVADPVSLDMDIAYFQLGGTSSSPKYQLRLFQENAEALKMHGRRARLDHRVGLMLSKFAIYSVLGETAYRVSTDLWRAFWRRPSRFTK